MPVSSFHLPAALTLTLASTLVGGTLMFAGPSSQEDGKSVKSPLDEMLERIDFDTYHRDLFFAVLQGLYRDGVQDEAIEGFLVKNDAGGYALFVKACPICMPALDAFRLYAGRPEFHGLKDPSDTFGEGISPELLAAATGKDMKARFEVLHDLVKRWVADYLDSQRLNPEEREAWRHAMEVGRKKGMSFLENQSVAGVNASFKACALCDGASDGVE